MNNYSQFVNFLYPNNKNNSPIIENNTLALNKFIKPNFHKDKEPKKKDKDPKKNLLRDIEKFSSINSAYIKESIEIVKNGLTQNNNFSIVYDGSLKSETPIVCGLGATHVFETSITLHHIWGVPYIPGSSLKGICRQVVFWELVELKKIPDCNSELEKFQNKFYGDLVIDDDEISAYHLLFGAQDFKGLFLFLDAYPECSNNDKIFKLDIMNSHYASYYSDLEGKTPPADWEKLNPIFFLTVKEGVKFRFLVLFDKWRWQKIKGQMITVNDKKININDNISNKIETMTKNNNFFDHILKKALSFYGVGSKTRLGYGIFKV